LKSVVRVLVELVLAPMLAAAATVAARRWGPRTGGVVSAFPAIVGPVLLITALDHGSAFTARAANGTLLGLVALSGFALAYGRTAVHGRWPLSLAAGWACAAFTALGAGLAAGGAGSPVGLLAALISLAIAHRALPPASAADAPAGGFGPAESSNGIDGVDSTSDEVDSPSDGVDSTSAAADSTIPLRMALTAMLVASLSAAAGALGALVGGMLAALPVLASVLAVFTHRAHGGPAVIALLRGTLAGMAGFVAFCEVVAVLIVRYGIAPAFGVATVAAVVVQAIIAACASPSAAGWVSESEICQRSPPQSVRAAGHLSVSGGPCRAESPGGFA
jgi:hypothetical protein